jgi:cytochrome c oxidase cbb3-type subunit 3/ubiquinol-cytochrome c reductase cytochrome c subunit
MKTGHAIPLLLLGALGAFSSGCLSAPGKPGPYAEALRPEQVLDFPTLYKQNCAACHGEDGMQGVAISLRNPEYLAFAGAGNIGRITADGVPHTLMPAFSKRAGGSLTDEQIGVLTRGMVEAWGDLRISAGLNAPPYASTLIGDPANGKTAFQSNCSRCHGTEGTGKDVEQFHTGSIVEPSYLALVSDQSLRTIIVAGHPAKQLQDRMPDWRLDAVGPAARAMTGQEIADIVAWLAAHRSATPGQPYPQHP